MKPLVLFISLLFFFAATNGQTKRPASHKKNIHTLPFRLVTNLDSTSYAYGVGLIKDLKSRNITTLNYTALNKAIADGLSDGTTLLTPAHKQNGY